MEKVKLTGLIMVGLYLGLGCLNSVIAWTTISHNDCMASDGIVALYCNAGTGISHLVSIVLWPMFWI